MKLISTAGTPLDLWSKRRDRYDWLVSTRGETWGCDTINEVDTVILKLKFKNESLIAAYDNRERVPNASTVYLYMQGQTSINVLAELRKTFD